MTSFHLLDLRDTHYPYVKGWIDRSDAVLLANFKLLKEFVEKEKPFEFCYSKTGRRPSRKACFDNADYTNRKRQAWVGAEIWKLFTWWTQTRKEEQDTLQKLLMTVYHGAKKSKEQMAPLMSAHPKWNTYYRMDERLRQKDQKMLHRLIDIREDLWT